jgi:hypothetical protein
MARAADSDDRASMPLPVIAANLVAEPTAPLRLGNRAGALLRSAPCGMPSISAAPFLSSAIRNHFSPEHLNEHCHRRHRPHQPQHPPRRDQPHQPVHPQGLDQSINLAITINLPPFVKLRSTTKQT